MRGPRAEWEVSMRAVRGLARLAASAAIAVSVSANAQEASYALSYLPDERDNVICFSRGDALALLSAFHAAYTAAEDPRAMRLMREFAGEFGPGRRFDCAFLRSIFVPSLPIDAVDVAVERALDWGERDEHFFVASSILIGETKYTQTETGGRIYVFASDFVIEKR